VVTRLATYAVERSPAIFATLTVLFS